MAAFQEEDMLVQDREDVIAVLRMRFDGLSNEMIEKIYRIDQLDALQRLILVAANAADLNIFLEELQADETSFRLLGERFDPMGRQ